MSQPTDLTWRVRPIVEQGFFFSGLPQRPVYDVQYINKAFIYQYIAASNN